MLYEEKLYEGLSVELVIAKGEYQGRYRTRIEEIGTRILSIGVPVAQGQFIPLREGTELELIFANDICAYSFFTTIIKRIALPVPTFILEFPSKIHKIQRRKYVRVPVIRTIKYRVLDKAGISEEKEAYMFDLSGGGLLMTTTEKLEPATLILIQLMISSQNMEIPGTVIRAEKDEDKGVYKTSIEFHEITEKTRDQIIRHVFDIQREMRKKGLV